MTDWIRSRDHAALFCGCGLGKTAATLDAIDHRMIYDGCKGALIIAPIRVCAITWPNEVTKWDRFKWMRVAHLRTPEGRRAWENGTADIYLINPEQLQKLVPVLFGKKDIPVDILVWDELSQAKNPSSKRVKVLRPHLSKFRHRIGLTGTPVPNSYLDLFAQVRLLDLGERFGLAYTRFQREFFTSDYMGYKWEIRPGAKEIIDDRIADLALSMSSEDYLDVPEATTIDVDVTLPSSARGHYKEMEKHFLMDLASGEIEASTAAVRTMKLVQITSGAVYDEGGESHPVHDAKMKGLRMLLSKHDEPVMVMTLFRHEKERVLMHTGAFEFHESLVPAWREGKIPVMVADPRQMSHGIDGLQNGGRIIIWFSPTYSHETYVQTNARFIRQGQTKETLVYRLLAKDTVDDAVAEAVRDKTDTQSGLMASLKAWQRNR